MFEVVDTVGQVDECVDGFGFRFLVFCMVGFIDG